MISNRLLSAWLIFIFLSLLITCNLRAAEWSDDEIEAMAVRAEATVQKAYEFIWQYRQQFDLADKFGINDYPRRAV